MNEVISFLDRHDDFLILTHQRPDGDTLGSAAALCAGLRSVGKTAYIWRNPEITKRYMPYTKPYFPPDGYLHSAAVSVDTATASQLGKTWNGKVHLRIDHHLGSDGYAETEYTDPSTAACGEVIMDLLKGYGIALTKEIASALYIAIITDTGGFRHANTTAKTHRMIAELIESGADAHKLNTDIFSKSSLRIAVEAAIAENAEYTADGSVALASLSLSEKGDATEDDLENIAGLLQNIEGVRIALLLREETDCWRVSCRTSEPYSANSICGVLGGGGHERAAGAEIKGCGETARENALNALWKIYPELKC
jgi:phosphoesterase RecJ-like protein